MYIYLPILIYSINMDINKYMHINYSFNIHILRYSNVTFKVYMVHIFLKVFLCFIFLFGKGNEKWQLLFSFKCKVSKFEYNLYGPVDLTGFNFEVCFTVIMTDFFLYLKGAVLLKRRFTQYKQKDFFFNNHKMFSHHTVS